MHTNYPVYAFHPLLLLLHPLEAMDVDADVDEMNDVERNPVLEADEDEAKKELNKTKNNL